MWNYALPKNLTYISTYVYISIYLRRYVHTYLYKLTYLCIYKSPNCISVYLFNAHMCSLLLLHGHQCTDGLHGACVSCLLASVRPATTCFHSKVSASCTSHVQVCGGKLLQLSHTIILTRAPDLNGYHQNHCNSPCEHAL